MTSIILTNTFLQYDAAVISELYIRGIVKQAIYIIDDELHLYNLSEELRFYLPELKIIVFPHWDTFPYKKMSPSINVMSQRIQALSNILQNNNNYLVLSTINSIVQKVIPKDIVQNCVLKIFISKKIVIDNIINYFLNCGYNRVSTVYSMGEFAVRGSIVDVFLTQVNFPIRIDFNGDVIESILRFDENTQITDSQLINEVIIYPVSEIIRLNKYQNNNHLYQCKSIGEENYLPDFYEHKLQNIFDYLHGKTIIANDYIFENIEMYHKNIYDSYSSATQELKSITPDDLYLTLKEFHYLIKDYKKIFFLHFDNEKKIINDCDEETEKLDVSTIVNIKKIPEFLIFSQKGKSEILKLLIQYLKDNELQLIIACYSIGSLEYFINKFTEHDVILSRIYNFSDIKSSYNVTILAIKESCIIKSCLFITEKDLLGKKTSITFSARNKISSIIENEVSFRLNDIIVHKDYGIGKFIALETLKIMDSKHDFIKIQYKNNDKLFLPIENINLITLYGDNNDVVLDSLRSVGWQERKAKLKNRINNIAKELLILEAKRQLVSYKIFSQSQDYKNFCDEFPYLETEDQLNAILDIENDLFSGKIIDRLICGDVGVGKTEIIMRAAFLIATEDKTNQVVVIVPTTLLCNQHFEVFTKRFKNYPNIKIKQLSRIINRSERKKIKEELSYGEINIIIGTHALLSKDIVFFNLTLLIIDEEQHFGVRQKEMLKQLKTDIHVISLSATPIPRTLHMSLSGIKNFTLMKTLPCGRLPVKSFVIIYDEQIVKDAIIREYNRGGRVFYVCPYIHDMEEIYQKLTILLPNILIKIAHGKVSSRELDDIMTDFFNGKFIVLLSTSIIECGIDIPFANTMIIHNADIFGLAQLYQLKGRVGRSHLQAYVYFIISEKNVMNDKSIKKLESIKSINDSGSGFSISLHDMDMRGFGNLVGEEQSGHIKEVGIELYQQMLEEEILSLRKNIKDKLIINVNININLNIRIPEAYIEDLNLRMKIYKKIGALKDKYEIDRYIIEMINMFGTLPEEVKNLFDIIYIKQLCSEIGIYEVDFVNHMVILSVDTRVTFENNLLSYLISNPSTFKLEDNKIFILINNISLNKAVKIIVSYLEKMSHLNKK